MGWLDFLIIVNLQIYIRGRQNPLKPGRRHGRRIARFVLPLIFGGYFLMVYRMGINTNDEFFKNAFSYECFLVENIIEHINYFIIFVI